jgi:oligopeptidase B
MIIKPFFTLNKIQKHLRSDKVYKHKLGNDASKDELVYFEKDDTFNVSVSKEKSKKYIVIESSSTLTTESRIFGQLKSR